MASPGSPQALTVAQAKRLEAALQLLRAGKAGDALAISHQLASEAVRAPGGPA